MTNTGKSHLGKSLPERITDSVGSTTSIIVHTVFFIGVFSLRIFGVETDDILLVLTTVVSLEAIYLAIFIQMTVNKSAKSLAEVELDLDEIQEDVQEMEKDIDEIQVDIDEIQEDDKEEAATDAQTKLLLETIEERLRKLMSDLEAIKKNK